MQLFRYHGMCKFKQKLFKAASSCTGEMKVDICLHTYTCTHMHTDSFTCMQSKDKIQTVSKGV